MGSIKFAHLHPEFLSEHRTIVNNFICLQIYFPMLFFSGEKENHIMSEIKMGKKGGPRHAAKQFEKIHNQPVSKRISDFLIEEGRKEKDHEGTKKSARPTLSKDLDV